jgi:hypothetical protein
MNIGERPAFTEEQALPEEELTPERLFRLMNNVLGKYSDITDRVRDLEDKSKVPQPFSPIPVGTSLRVPPVSVPLPTSPAVSALNLEVPTDEEHFLGRLRLQQPEAFRGERSKFRNFRGQVKLWLHLHDGYIKTEQDKILVVGTLLKGPAFAWFETRVRDKIPWETYVEFENNLQLVYGDSDELATAERSLTRLRQTTSCSQYVSEFVQIASYLSWDDKALSFAFYKGLKDSVKDELARVERITSLPALMETATKIDNRLYERRLEKKGLTLRSLTAAAEQSSTDSKANYGPQPMELDAIITSTSHQKFGGPLSASDREYRKKHNLCLYCGLRGHRVQQCSRKPPDRRTTFAATKTQIKQKPVSPKEKDRARK